MQLIAPGRSVGVPGRSVDVPGRSVGIPGRPVGIPGRSVGIPGRSVGNNFFFLPSSRLSLGAVIIHHSRYVPLPHTSSVKASVTI